MPEVDHHDRTRSWANRELLRRETERLAFVAAAAASAAMTSAVTISRSYLPVARPR